MQEWKTLIWEENSRSPAQEGQLKKVVCWDLVHNVQLSWHLESSAAMMQVGLVTTQVSSSPWHHLCAAFLWVCKIQELWGQGRVHSNFRRTGRPGSVPLTEKTVSKTVRMKTKLLWGSQYVGEPGNMNICWGKLLAMNEASPKEKPRGLHLALPQGWVYSKPLEFICCHCLSQVLDIELRNLMFALLIFNLVLVRFISIPLFLPFEMVMFILCNCMLAVFNLLFDLCMGIIDKFALSLWRDCGLELFNSAGPVKILDSLGWTK